MTVSTRTHADRDARRGARHAASPGTNGDDAMRTAPMSADPLHDPEIRRVFEEEYLVGEATETIAGLVASLGITRRELARRLGVTEGRVSQALSGGTNLTLRSLAGMGWALGVRFDLHPVPMTDRRGTPADGDPPAPQWLTRLRQHEPQTDYTAERINAKKAGRARRDDKSRWRGDHQQRRLVCVVPSRGSRVDSTSADVQNATQPELVAA